MSLPNLCMDTQPKVSWLLLVVVIDVIVVVTQTGSVAGVTVGTFSPRPLCPQVNVLQLLSLSLFSFFCFWKASLWIPFEEDVNRVHIIIKAVSEDSYLSSGLPSSFETTCL